MECLVNVSKNLDGTLDRIIQRIDKCDNGCLSLYRMYDLDATISAHDRCDKAKELDGTMHGRLEMVTEVDAHGRGYHKGRILWVALDGRIACTLDGMINCGTHREGDPPCERCDQPNHVEGAMSGMYVKGRKANFSGGYMINIKPRDEDFKHATFTGTIEGVVRDPCEPRQVV